MSNIRTRQTRVINDNGIGMIGAENDRVKDIRIYEENGTIQVWVEIEQQTALQYLSPDQAMQFSVVLERLAQIALRKSADIYPKY